jgi:uncharacterized membrane protein
MTASTAGKLRALAVVLVMGCWAVAAHYASSGAGNADFNAALGAIPIVLIAAVLLWQIPSRLGIAAGALAGAALIFWFWPQLRENVSLLYYLQHLGGHIALGVFFGRSLLGPGEALITRLARSIYGDKITARKIRYTRQATLAWTLFFFGNALVSTGLFLFAPPAIWSLHANLLTWPLVGLMFLGEHLVRMCLLPPEERPNLTDIITAYHRASHAAPQQQKAPPAQP